MPLYSPEERERVVEATTVEVEAEQAGRRLDRFLADRLEISRARVRHLLEVGRIRLADRTLELADKSHSTAAGERFEIAGSVRAFAPVVVLADFLFEIADLVRDVTFAVGSAVFFADAVGFC